MNKANVKVAVQQDIPIPQAIQKKFLKQMFGALCVVVLTIVLLFNLKRWEICVGFLLALFVVWLGFDTVWRYRKGKIVCKQMLVIRATKVLRSDRIYAVMRDIHAEGDPEKAIYQYYIPVSKKEASFISTNAILNVYCSSTNTRDLIAWELIDYAPD